MSRSSIHTFPPGKKGMYAMLLDLCRRLSEERTELKLENRRLKAEAPDWNWPRGS